MATPFRKYLYSTAFTCMLTLVISGMNFGWPLVSLPQLKSYSSSFKITINEAPWIAMLPLISAIPSSFIAAIVTDMIGRKKLILFTFIPNFYGWVIITFANSSLELCIARFLVGIADGIAFTCIPLYVGEFADPDIRGLLGAGMSVTWSFGILFIIVMGSRLRIITTAVLGSVVPLILLSTFAWMPESPYYLLMKNDISRARSALSKFKESEDVDNELLKLQQVVKNQRGKKGRFIDLFNEKSNLKALVIMSIVGNSQLLSEVALFSFYTVYSFYDFSDFVFIESNTMGYVGVQCLTTAVSSILADRLGRKRLFIASLLGSLICGFIDGACLLVRNFTSVDSIKLHLAEMITYVAFLIVANLGKPVPLLMLGELFPMNVKALASCIYQVSYCALVLSLPKLFTIISENYVIFHVRFSLSKLYTLVNFLLILFFLPETKKKTLEEIQECLGAKRPEENTNSQKYLSTLLFSLDPI